MHTKTVQRSNLEHREHYGKKKCRISEMQGKRSRVNWKNEGENLEKRKDEQKLKGDVDFEIFLDDRELFSEEDQHSTEKENFSEDVELLSSISRKAGKYHLRRRHPVKDNRGTVKPKNNITSNHLGNEADVNNVNQCKHMVIKLEIKIMINLSIKISLMICNTRCTENIGQLWFIKRKYNQMDNQHINIITMQFLYCEKYSYVVKQCCTHGIIFAIGTIFDKFREGISNWFSLNLMFTTVFNCLSISSCSIPDVHI